jgi:hypothetical protein
LHGLPTNAEHRDHAAIRIDDADPGFMDAVAIWRACASAMCM